ncbi:hypothetical protein GGF32_008082 [Allomyces javanicus]|nr:hypothetical protein GGF32_008082 [Allomyces javanicus]
MNRSPVVAASSASARASTPPLRSALKSPARASPVKTATFAGMATDAAAIQLANADSTTITSLGIPGAQRPGSFEHDPHATDDDDDVPATALAEDESDRAPSTRVLPSAPPATGTAMRRHAAAAAAVGGMAAPMGHDEDETERVVRQLLEFEGGLNVLLDRVKQNLVSAKDVTVFLKKRAAIEEEYGRSMMKLAGAMTEATDRGDGKGGMYAACVKQMVAIHETIATNRLQFATHITQVCEELTTVHKDTDRSRKQLKDASERYERALRDSESALDKAKAKQEATSDVWDKARQALRTDLPRGAASPPTGPTGLSALFAKPPEKEEEAARHRAARANDAYQTQLAATLALRNEFQRSQLPSLVHGLKEVNDECDVALQFHLAKYAFHYEQTLTADAQALCPVAPPMPDGTTSAVSPPPGIRKVFEQMDHAADLQDVITAAANAAAAAKAADAANAASADRGLAPALSSLSLVGPPARPVFGVSLQDLGERDNTDVPVFLTQAMKVIEEVGLDVQGLYRVSGSSIAVQRLRAQCDRDLANVSWNPDDYASDIHTLASAIKLFLRSLPDSVLPRSLARQLLQAARLPDARVQLLTLHDLINGLPEPNYCTLRAVIQHLDRVALRAARNQMHVHNLSIVFGPTLMHGGAVAVAQTHETANEMHLQCRVVEVVLSNCRIIFEPDEA